MSPVCTHLGCTVGDAEENTQKTGIRFLCPCHAGQYNEYGINVAGPPPRPLDIFDAYVQDGNVYIAVLSPRKREK
ncbi:ubiquinol-cytochrome c reductase iron-sulfur subunit [Geobacillus sp. 46C-IIa]|uniref:QcrA and Rieske domain-containing protein n=1 Tax=Geobacillus sp. 46C-IIa TaxID=1963025 RepID=UPI001E3CECD1|nr:Rieske 2Fe-2S domain-containing protein [Geobacillus sp. 46C-IIa]